MSETGEAFPGPRGELIVLIPVYNDWDALRKLLAALDTVLIRYGPRADVLIVDDGSTAHCAAVLAETSFERLGRVNVLSLRRNLGHQRAIAVGLAYLESETSYQAVVVMDGDGEDDPGDVPRLLEKCRDEGNVKIVFAERTRRSESWIFRLFYALYKLMHYLLTGRGVRVGNFSVIPRARLTSLVVVSEMWNHYAAAAFASRQPCATVPTRRAQRLGGRSSMNFIQLVTHGLSAISVYRDLVGVRMFVAAAVLTAAALAGLGAVLAAWLLTDWAIPGWAMPALGVLLVLLAQAVMFVMFIVFTVLGGRQGMTFLPRRDYHHFVGSVTTIYQAESDLAPKGP